MVCDGPKRKILDLCPLLLVISQQHPVYEQGAEKNGECPPEQTCDNTRLFQKCIL